MTACSATLHDFSTDEMIENFKKTLKGEPGQLFTTLVIRTPDGWRTKIETACQRAGLRVAFSYDAATDDADAKRMIAVWKVKSEHVLFREVVDMARIPRCAHTVLDMLDRQLVIENHVGGSFVAAAFAIPSPIVQKYFLRRLREKYNSQTQVSIDGNKCFVVVITDAAHAKHLTCAKNLLLHRECDNDN